MPPSDKPQGPTASAAVTGTMPAYMKNTAPATMPSGLPGQIPAIAQQLGIGFGLPPQAFLKALNQVYRPAQTMNFNVPPVAAKKPAPKLTPTSPLNVTKPSDKYTYAGGRNAR